MSVKRIDLHVHTGYSFDNQTPMSDYPAVALERGVDVVCFTDHVDCTPNFNVFDSFQFGKRAEEFHKIKQQYQGKIKFLLGFEVGEPHLHPEIMKFLYSLQPDMLIGSIHRPADYEPPRTYTDFQYERLYDQYVRDMVSAGGFDVVGHMDNYKRFHTPYQRDEKALFETLELCVKNGIVPEINTSWLRYGGTETIPALADIFHYRDVGGKFVTIGSDSHDASLLGTNFDLVAGQLPQGVSLCYFENRKLIPIK